LRKFSLRQSRDGDVAARGSAKSATAIDWPQICHAAERFGGEGCGAWPAGKLAFQSYFMSVTIRLRLAASEAHVQVKERGRVKIVVD
jgi:hypothetical protein